MTGELRQLHMESFGGTECLHCGESYGGAVPGSVWPCATVREIQRIDKELGND